VNIPEPVQEQEKIPKKIIGPLIPLMIFFNLKVSAMKIFILITNIANACGVLRLADE
jgi:Na+/H+-dicarboxylate symporter